MKQKAFTLIELLVVIVIIGILATISTATFSNYIERSRDVKQLSLANDLNRNIQTFLTEDQSSEVTPMLTVFLGDSIFLNRLLANDFSLDYDVSTDPCMHIGVNTSDDSQYFIAYPEQAQTTTLATIGNHSPLPNVPYTTCPTGTPAVALTVAGYDIYRLSYRSSLPNSPVLVGPHPTNAQNCIWGTAAPFCF